MGALLTTALESGVGVCHRLLFHEQECQSEGEPHQRREEIILHFKTFGEHFVKEVRSRDNPAFIAKLQHQNVIPECLKNAMTAANNNGTANSFLLGFPCEQATCESLTKLLTAMTEVKGYSVMSNLGKEIKSALGL